MVSMPVKKSPEAHTEWDEIPGHIISDSASPGVFPSQGWWGGSYVCQCVVEEAEMWPAFCEAVSFDTCLPLGSQLDASP